MLAGLGLRILQVNPPCLSKTLCANTISKIIFAVIVLSLSGDLIKGQEQGKAPSQTVFASFCAVGGLVCAAIGIIAGCIPILGGILMSVLDGLLTIFTLAGGIALAVALQTTSCSDVVQMAQNDIIRGFSASIGAIPNRGTLQTRCHEAQATDAFLFFMFAAFAGSLAHSHL